MPTVKTVTLQLFAKTAEAQAQLDAIAAKAKELGDLNPTIKPKIDKAAVTAGLTVLRAEMKAAGKDANSLSGQLDSVGKDAAKAGGASGIGALVGSGGIAGGGMGALIGAAIALSPYITSIGFGLAGFGAAAVGAAAPILKAAQNTGGLAANMKSLNPEQQKAAKGLLALGQQFSTFEGQLQPQVLHVFNQGLNLAGHLLGDVQPVAQATGKALGGVLGQIDAEFQSGTWQQFFGFMARTAGPDIQNLGGLFVALMQDLPPLVQALQPVADGLVHIATDAAKVAQPLGTFATNAEGSAHKSDQAAKSIDSWTVAFTNRWIPGAKTVNRLLGDVQHAAGGTAAGLKDGGDAAAIAGPKFFSLNQQVAALNTSMTKLAGNLVTLQGDNVTWRQAMQAAETQLKSNTAGLDGNSKNALANKQAVIAATNAAIAFAGQELTTGKNIGGASRTVQDQIRWLQGLHDKSQFVRSEIEALQDEEAKLQAQKINQTIHVQGLGQWSVSQSLAPGAGHRRAMGGLIPGHGAGDTYPALLTPGEVVVPRPMVRAGAVDHLRGHLPGFAAGGLVPSYSGSPAMAGWVKADDSATVRLIDQAVVKATVAGARAAASAAASTFAAGPGGGAPAANAALARHMFPAQNFAAWNYVAMAESGWNQFARNPSSGAYGIPQALPPSKMGAAANPPESNPAAQISWMNSYMNSVYGGASGAAAHEAAFHWYDHGGWLPTGLSLALNTTGRPERVGAGGGHTYNITVHVGHGTHPVAAAKEIAKVLNAGAMSGVKLRTSILGPG